jgi:hypothetical protein
MPINIDELKGKKAALESEIKRFQEAIEYKLSKGEFDVDNMCARVNQLEKLLLLILNQLRSYDPCNGDLESEQDRKAIAIIGGGKGVEIRAKNDDATKYFVKKRLSYDDVIQKRRRPKPNGQAKQQQQQPQAANI